MNVRELAVIRILLFVARLIAFDDDETRKEIDSLANHITYRLAEDK